MSQDKYLPYKTYLSQVKLRGCVRCLNVEGHVFKCLSKEKYPLTNWRVQVAKGFEKFKLDVDTKYICICFSCARKKEYRRRGEGGEEGGGGEGGEERKKKEEMNSVSSLPQQVTSSTPMLTLSPPLPEYCQCGQCYPVERLQYQEVPPPIYVFDIPLGIGKGMVSPLCREVYKAQQDHISQLQKEIEKKEVLGEISHDSQFAAVELANLLKQIEGKRKLYKQFFLNKATIV